MRISTLVSSHNKAATVARACRSALLQSHPPCEVVVCEDASQDGSAAVLDTLATEFPSLRILHYPEKSTDWMRDYLRHTRDLSGDYVHLLAADDWIASPDFYETLAKANASEMAGCREAKTDWIPSSPVARHPATPPGVFFANISCHTPGGVQISRSRYDLLPGHHFQDADLRRWLASGALIGGTATVLSSEACSWLRRNGAHIVGPWFDAALYPAAMWQFGVTYLPEVFGGFTEDPRGYGNQRDPVQRQKYRDGANTFFSQRDVRDRLGDGMANMLRDRVHA